MSDPCDTRDTPTYDLALIKRLVLSRQYHVTGAALDGRGELGLEPRDMEQCILALRGFEESSTDFKKSMRSSAFPDRWQDVYNTSYCGHPIYVKLQVVEQKASRKQAIIISFKRK